MKKVTDKQLIDAIRKNAGIVSGILQTLKTEYGIEMTRFAIYKRKESSKKIAEAFEEAEEAVLDIAENNIVEYIKGGNLKATMFYLRLKGRKRGYVTNEQNAEQEPEHEGIRIYFERPGD
jgi:uncharacterized protein YecE (DUF72 family)